MPALLLPGLIFFGALVLVALNQTLMIWSKSQTEAQGSAWKTILGAITGKAYVTAITRAVRGPVSRWALAQLTPVARWFVALNAVVIAHSNAVADAEDAIADGFERLRHVVIPRATGRAVTPIKSRVTKAQRTATHAASRAAHANTAVTHLRGNVIPRVKTVEHATTAVLPGQIGRVRDRVGKLDEKVENPPHSLLKRWAGLLWAAGLAGLFVKALAKRFPWLFCRKVQTVGKRLCGLDDSLLQSLLSDTLAIVGAVSLLEFIADAQAVETVALDALSDFIREMPKV
jgi:hypothetical protein